MNIPGRFALRVSGVSALLMAYPAAQSRSALVLRVTETAGIRRAAYPTNARVHFQRGALADAGHARLLSSSTEVPAQFGAESSYPDGSAQWLTVDFNVSLGPRETVEYVLEYGDAVQHRVDARGLTVSQDAGGIQVGSVRLSLTGAPLVASVKYRREDIGAGANGFSIVDAAGKTHDAQPRSGRE